MQTVAIGEGRSKRCSDKATGGSRDPWWSGSSSTAGDNSGCKSTSASLAVPFPANQLAPCNRNIDCNGAQRPSSRRKSCVLEGQSREIGDMSEGNEVLMQEQYIGALPLANSHCEPYRLKPSRSRERKVRALSRRRLRRFGLTERRVWQQDIAETTVVESATTARGVCLQQ